MKKRMTIEITFNEEQDEYDEDYTFLEFESMRILDEATDLTEAERSNIAEQWGQSDWYSVGFNNALITLVDEAVVIEAKDIKSY